jgi:hypothetical protein
MQVRVQTNEKSAPSGLLKSKMTLFFERAFRALAKAVTALVRSRQIPSHAFANRKRKELEAERLDRLRNPSNYQGR